MLHTMDAPSSAALDQLQVSAGGCNNPDPAPFTSTPAGEQAAQQQQHVINQAQQDAAEVGAAGLSAAAGSDDEEKAEFDAELATWLAGRLNRMQPGVELTVGSVKVLGKLLDEITERVLDEARQINNGEAAAALDMPTTTAAAPPENGKSAAQAAAGQQQEGRGKRQQKLSALTSLDIHKALKRVLPGEPAENKLRPYLPAVTKQAWHLDKESLKGIKRQKQAAAGAATLEAASGSECKENEQQQQQQQDHDSIAR